MVIGKKGTDCMISVANRWSRYEDAKFDAKGTSRQHLSVYLLYSTWLHHMTRLWVRTSILVPISRLFGFIHHHRASSHFASALTAWFMYCSLYRSEDPASVVVCVGQIASNRVRQVPRATRGRVAFDWWYALLCACVRVSVAHSVTDVSLVPTRRHRQSAA